jgi:hypothetical protein
MDELAGMSKAERKKARRRERKSAERAEGQELEALTDQAVEIAMQLAPEVAAAPTRESSERVIDVSVTTVDAARFVRKRINEALAFNEWHDEIEAWVWEADTSVRPALTERGGERGVEVRLEQVTQIRN